MAGKLALAKLSGTIEEYEVVMFDPKKVADLSERKVLLVLTEPVEVIVAKGTENDPFVGVTLADDPKKLGLLFCRRTHLTPPAPEKK